MLAFPIGERFALFIVSGSSEGKRTDNPPTVPQAFVIKWGLDCRAIEAFMFDDLILTIEEELAMAIKDCLTHDLANQHGQQRLASLGRNNMVNNCHLTVVRA
jgi:hypothetical protein